MNIHKRIIQIDPATERDLLTHAVFGVTIRPARNGGDEINTWVIETSDRNEIRAVNKIVKLFAIDCNCDQGATTMTTPSLTRAFHALRKRGYFARQNFWCCSSCGWAAIPEEKASKAVFYHQQDRESLKTTGAVYLAWSGDASEIASVFRCEGFEVEHNGSPHNRILVKVH